MRVSGKWLNELVDIPKDATAAIIAERLTAAGLEVEEIKDLGAQVEGVVVGRVMTCIPHENADKLKVCTVDAGAATADGPVTVVCGAPNVYEGAVVCFAQPGTVLPGNKAIAIATVRGIESRGMLCSSSELGLPADLGATDGILLLNDVEGATLGTPIAQVLGCDDVIYTLGVTPNRPDALSHLGVARELAATFKTRLKGSNINCPERGGPIDGIVHVSIDDVDGCARYACRLIEDVVVQPSPAWLQARLAALGVRSINNIVDVTNLVMLERGIPLHAFDYDKIQKQGTRANIVVRSARAGEKITTLDTKERTLVEGDVVVADGAVDAGRAIAIAGVMGGAETEVTKTTTRVLIEGAHFSPSRVRRTARRLDLHSEASHRFERGTDPNGVLQSIDRAAGLMAEFSAPTGTKESKARIARGAVDTYPKKIAPAVVTLRPQRAAKLLGVNPKLVDEASASKMLLSLGLEVEGREAEAIRFRVPTYRPDLLREVDLIEELLRLLGTDVVPSTLPARAGENESVLFDERRHRTLLSCRAALQSAGYDEAVNLAFASPTEVTLVPAWDDVSSDPIKVLNPLGEERSLLRRSLLPGLIQNAALNHRRGTADVRLYEAATVFLGKNPDGGVPHVDDRAGPAGGDAYVREHPRLAGIACGAGIAGSFDGKPRQLDFYDVKGHLEELCAQLGVEVGFEAAGDDAKVSFLHPRSACLVSVATEQGDAVVGVIGELHPDVEEHFETREGAVVFELDLDVLAKAARVKITARPLPRFPSVRRDFALVVDQTLPAATLRARFEACAAAEGLMEQVDIFDVYQGKGVAAGKKSIAVAVTLRAADRTLTEADVSRISDALVKDVAALGAEVRAG